MNIYLLVCVIWTVLCNVSFAKQPLNNFIRHHEKLSYDTVDVHKRTKRALELSPFANVHIKFEAHAKNFSLHLRRSHELFSQDFKIVDGGGRKIDYDYSRFFHGDAEGFHRSHCLGLVHEGRFEGAIHLGNDIYHVEPAERYFQPEHIDGFHSVIYSGHDVEHEGKYAEAEKPARPTTLKGSHSFKDEKKEDKKEEDLKEKGKGRYKRGTKNLLHNTCNLKLVADHLFMKKFVRRETAIDQMVLHYQAVEYIFRNQTFNTTGELDTNFNPQGIGFRIKEVHVWTDMKDVPFAMQKDSISIYTLLEEFSKMNHSSACLSYLFTDRSFDDGVTGLAYVSYPYGQPGGICDPYATYGGIWKSYNTGLLTFQLYNREAPRAITEITFAHELGHSFGAQHDPPSKKCQPGESKGGNYIMYDKSTPGHLKNNRAFSECSIAKMIPVINAKGLDGGCFTDRMFAICGNGAHEEGEICDCGTTTTCVEKCCVPFGSKDGLACTLRNEAYECSPSRGPCCLNDTCTIAREFLKCFDGTECQESLTCDGLRFVCPERKFKPNMTLCDKDRSVCINGFCQGSLCTRYGYEGCLCSGSHDKCQVCCQYKGQCTSSYAIPEMPNVTKSRGTPCDYYKGFCDALGQCQAIDMDGPMKLLYYTFFTEEGIKIWFSRYWFVVLLGSFLILCMLAAFVYYCQYFTPSNNPLLDQKKPHKPIRKTRKRVGGGGYMTGGQPIPMSTTYT